MDIQNKLTAFLAVVEKVAKKTGVLPLTFLAVGAVIGLVGRFLIPLVMFAIGVLVGIYLASMA